MMNGKSDTNHFPAQGNEPAQSTESETTTMHTTSDTGKTLANWIVRNALEDLATRLQRHLIALKAQEIRNHE